MPNYARNIKQDFGLKYDSKDVGKHIVKLRKQKKMSRNQLVFKSHVDGTAIMRIERGECSPVLDTLFRIIGGLGLQPKEFFEAFG